MEHPTRQPVLSPAHTPTRLEALAQLQEKLAQLPPRTRINMLLNWGMPADTVMGVDACAEHRRGRLLRDTESLSFEGDVVWCKGCYRWYKMPEPVL